MGNHNGKDSYRLTGSPLDFFQTPPTTPSEAELNAMALSSEASYNKVVTSSSEAATGTTPSTASPVADWTQKLSAPSEWAVITVDTNVSPETTVSDGAAGPCCASSLPPSMGSLSDQSWQERDSGLEPQAAAEKGGDEMSLVLLSLMEHYRASLGLTPNSGATTGPVELLKHLITEREELFEEVSSLRETLRTERLEWQQFQCDLQVAVSVADRLRAESEQALSLLQESHRSVEEQLARALSRQQDQDRDLAALRTEHRGVCNKLAELTVQQQRDRGELDALRRACGEKSDTEDATAGQNERGKSGEKMEETVKEAEAEPERKENAVAIEMDAKGVDEYPEESNGSGNKQVKGKGVAEGYLRSLAAQERKKDGREEKDPRRIVMLSERSWSLSRLPFSPDSFSQNASSKNSSTTLPLCKKEEPTRGRVNRVLQRQDSWSSICTATHDEDQSSDSFKPRDGFSALLRRHGGSRRNSLLRWCQGRTQGYKNIDITNFSSSWEDGLAFCAVYHTYLPTRIPFDSLNPAEKKENLDLAFKTGESVGITATLTVDDMVKADGPDWQRVLGYVESIFRHFEM